MLSLYSFDKLKIGHRFVMAICIFSLPLGVLFYFNIDQISGKISFATSEIEGNHYQVPLVKLIGEISRYQASAGRDDTQKQSVEGLWEAADKAHRDAAAKLTVDDASLSAAGLESLKWPGLRSRWQELDSLLHSDPKATAPKNAALLADVHSLISRVGDTSNLTLDPEMDSYYLADITSVCAAQALERINSAETFAEQRMVGDRVPGAEDRAQVAVFAALFKQSDFDRISGDIETAVKENPKALRGPSPTLRRNIEPAAARSN